MESEDLFRRLGACKGHCGRRGCTARIGGTVGHFLSLWVLRGGSSKLGVLQGAGGLFGRLVDT